jgi:hypothetical protein
MEASEEESLLFGDSKKEKERENERSIEFPVE